MAAIGRAGRVPPRVELGAARDFSVAWRRRDPTWMSSPRHAHQEVASGAPRNVVTTSSTAQRLMEQLMPCVELRELTLPSSRNPVGAIRDRCALASRRADTRSAVIPRALEAAADCFDFGDDVASCELHGAGALVERMDSVEDGVSAAGRVGRSWPAVVGW